MPPQNCHSTLIRLVPWRRWRAIQDTIVPACAGDTPFEAMRSQRNGALNGCLACLNAIWTGFGDHQPARAALQGAAALQVLRDGCGVLWWAWFKSTSRDLSWLGVCTCKLRAGGGASMTLRFIHTSGGDTCMRQNTSNDPTMCTSCAAL